MPVTSGIYTLKEAKRLASNGQWVANPSAPQSLAATAGNTQVALAWSAPATLGDGGAIVDYEVEYSTDGTSWTVFADGVSTMTSATVTGLTNGTEYQFRLRAKSNLTGAYATATSTPSSSFSATLQSGGGSNTWRWQSNGYFTDSDSMVSGGSFIVGRESGTGMFFYSGWRTVWTPASKPTSITSALWTISTSSLTGSAFSVLCKGANLDDASQGLQGSSPTTASATATSPSSGDLVLDVTGILSEIVGRAGWSPGNGIVLYLLGDNAPSGSDWRHNPDAGGSIEVVYTL